MTTETKIKYAFSAQELKPLVITEDTADLMDAYGVSISDDSARAINQYAALMDALPAGVTPASNQIPIQFLQYWADPIKVITKARKVEKLTGRTIGGGFATEEVCRAVVEPTGTPKEYFDRSNSPYANDNKTYEHRDVYRAELASFLGKLEQEQASLAKLNILDNKRYAVTNGLEIIGNKIGFYGVAGRRTYGLLNDPNLNPTQTVADGASGDTEWSSKTYLEIAKDLLTAIAALRVQSGSNFDPREDEFVIGIADIAFDYIFTPNAVGDQSIAVYLTQVYPKIRFEAIPEFTGAVGGDNVFYVIAEQIGGQKVVDDFYTELFRMVGFENKPKGLEEVFATATAGVIINLPIGIVAYSGI